MKTLHVVIGPTAAGKTAYAVRLALQLHTEILSCDSRQFYRELRIGVARPEPDELAAVPHHFIACRSIMQPYNVYDFEQDALLLLERLFQRVDHVVAVGGSGLYIDALCHGVSPMPSPSPSLRSGLQLRFRTEGVEAMYRWLSLLDPDYAARVDARNPVRIQRALEVCLTAGRPYSRILAERQPAPRPFALCCHAVDCDSVTLRRRIDDRVDRMMRDGLAQEARNLEPLWRERHPQPLNTVGYKEFYTPLPDSSNPSAPHSIASWIKLNTWHYARKQRTWFRKYIQQTETTQCRVPDA